MPRLSAGLAALALALAAPAAEPEPVGRFDKDFRGQAPPELVGEADHWLAGPPARFAALKGKVVWLQFNF
jgi:hypothetical protein